MVERGRHGEGLGRQLLMARLRRVLEDIPDAREVILFTSGEVAGFHRHLGFVQLGTRPNQYGPGLDRVQFGRAIDARFRDATLGGS